MAEANPVTEEEDARQLAALNSTSNEPLAGRARYAAAMYFYHRGLISEDSLEVYRTCSVFDHEDPRPVLELLGLADEISALGSSINRRIEP
jgi:hypothetical protein